MENPKAKSNRLEVWIAVLIALVSLTTALATWRTASLGSKAGDLNYQGFINAIKRQASATENWRTAYQLAGYGRDYLIARDGLIVLENSTDPASQEFATQMRTYQLPAMETQGEPFSTDPSYLTPEGG